MSVDVMSAVFKRYPVGGGEMLLALALADHADDDGTHIFPSVATMAKKTRQSERAVQYQLGKMLESGWLILVRAARGGRKGGYPAEYRISSEWLMGAEIAPIPKKKPKAKKGEKSAPNNAVDNLGIGAEIAPIEPVNGCNSEQKWVQSEAEMGAKSDKPYRFTHQLTVNEPSAAATCACDVVDNPAAAADEQDLSSEQPSRDIKLGDLLVQLELDRGKQLTIDPTKDRIHLLSWVGRALTDQQLRDAHALAAAARKRDKDDRPTYVGFVAQFIGAAQAPQQAEAGPADPMEWHLTQAGTEARGAELGIRDRKQDEDWRYYRVLVVRASREPRAIERVLADAQRFNAVDLYQFARATFGDALMPVDDFAS